MNNTRAITDARDYLHTVQVHQTAILTRLLRESLDREEQQASMITRLQAQIDVVLSA